jgi:hypothetical protein
MISKTAIVYWEIIAGQSQEIRLELGLGFSH